MFWNKPENSQALSACQLQLDESNNLLHAIQSNVAYIEFSSDGNVLHANSLF